MTAEGAPAGADAGVLAGRRGPGAGGPVRVLIAEEDPAVLGYLVRTVGSTEGLVLAGSASGPAHEVTADVIGELGSQLTRQKREAAERRSTLERVRGALGGDLCMAYQPMFHLPTGALAGTRP